MQYPERTVCNTHEAHLQYLWGTPIVPVTVCIYVRVCSTTEGNSTDLPFVKVIHLGPAHSNWFVGVPDGYEGFSQGYFSRIRLCVDMSIYFEAVNLVKLTLESIAKKELQEVKKQLEANKLAY